jgi:SAM-dependent methyltransferase
MPEIQNTLIRIADAARLSRQGVSRAVYAAIYEAGAPWCIGRHQPVVAEWEASGAFAGAVCDIGCGPGDNAFFLASRGHAVTGIDYVEQVVLAARRDPRQAQSPVRFLQADILDAGLTLGPFDTILDSGTFHGFSDAERQRYAARLAALLRPGGRLLLLAFSAAESRPGGPRRVSEGELRQTFPAPDWGIERIREAAIEARIFDGRAAALAAEILRR